MSLSIQSQNQYSNLFQSAGYAGYTAINPVKSVQSYQNNVNSDYESLNRKYLNNKNNKSALDVFSGTNAKHTASADTFSVRKNMLEKLRELTQSKKQSNPFAATSEDKKNGFMEISGAPGEDEEDLLPENDNYNFKEVSNKIQRAKNSTSAGQAVLAAKRKILELKRKLASSDGDSEELQLAITHARQMERVAKRKKKNLELEELAENTAKRDERQNRIEEAAKDMGASVIDMKEEEIRQAEDEIQDEKKAMLEDIEDSAREAGEEISGDLMEELDELIEELGDEEMEALEDMMEELQEMEIIDPHMSREDLDKLKTKHRNKENRDLIKADMDYLKDYIKHMEKVNQSLGGIGGGSAQGGVSAISFTAIAGDISSAPSAAEVASQGIDIQI